MNDAGPRKRWPIGDLPSRSPIGPSPGVPGEGYQRAHAPPAREHRKSPRARTRNTA